ncbi:MAG: IS3 family transposase [Eubacterium sp.]
MIALYFYNNFIDEINNYIIRYNTKRIKHSLGYIRPVEYRDI